ncbi:MAG: prolipoprotein diacylglyceryl transferase [Candidatus Dadabacteria bacterium]|nr:MAG: prolipoprotein diacylglyceryl transferase [Candidatus Dadabacteria bacterium]
MHHPYLHTLDPFAIQFGDHFGIRWYGLAYLAGFFFSYLIIHYLIKKGRSELSPKLVSDFVFTAALGTIIGGRLGYCIFYSPDLFFEFTKSPPFWGVLAINRGGMASHGGIIGVVLACLYFGKRHSVNGLHLIDLSTLGAALGIFCGRIANFINGELVGRPCREDFIFAVKFPQDILAWPEVAYAKLYSLTPVVEKIGVKAEAWKTILSKAPYSAAAATKLRETLQSVLDAIQSGNLAVQQAIEPLLTPRHPSQLYAALLEGLLVFLLLVFIWRKPRKPGVITACFFIFYSIVRIFDEQFRMPDIGIGFQLWGLTRGQWLSVGLLAFGFVFLWYVLNKKTSGNSHQE